MKTVVTAGYAVATAVALLAAPVQAAYYFSSANAASGTTQVPGVTQDGFTQGAVPNSWTAESKTVTASDFGLGWAKTWASADNGMLKVYGWAQGVSTAPNCCSGGGGSGSATAAFQDNFTVRSSQFADGTTATITVRVLIDGNQPLNYSGKYWSSVQTWSWNFSLAGLQWSDGTSIFADGTNGINQVGPGFGYRVYSANIILGQAATTRMSIYTGVRGEAGGYGGSSVTAISDLGHTVTWRGITSLTVDGVPVTDFTAFSDTTGFDFRRGIVDAGAVPEPASWAMLIAGFGLVGGMARRRRAVPAA